MDKEKLKEQARVVLEKVRAAMSEIKENFKADEDATGARRVQSRFVNLWKSGTPGRVALIASPVVVLLLLLPVFVFIRGCGSDSSKTMAALDAAKAVQNTGGDNGGSGKKDAAKTVQNTGGDNGASGEKKAVSVDVAKGATDVSREERKRVSELEQVKEIFALARKSAEEDFNINFAGFFVGMSRYDAEDLAAYYKLGKDEYRINAFAGKAVRRLWFSLRGVRRITREGNTVEELGQAVANRVGDLKGYDGGWERKTLDGVVVTFNSRGLTILNENVASQKPIVTKANAQREANAQEECIQSIIRNMVGLPGTSFKMGKYEVTQVQWYAVMGAIKSEFWGDEKPIEKVSWEACQEFLRRLNALPAVRKSGLVFRLPKEGEWEYACRAGATGNYCKLVDGTEITESSLGEVAWHEDNSGGTPHPVGQKKPNAFGLYDMLGNVWEWCEELYQPGRSYRVARGGSWHRAPTFCVAGHRDNESVSGNAWYIGLRLAADQGVPSISKDEQREVVQGIIRDMVAIPYKNFKMGKYEVTQKQWVAVMGSIPPRCPFLLEDAPIVRVSWNDCKKFLAALNERPEVKASGLTFRLPLGAEWKFACGAGGKGKYCRLEDGTEITEETLGRIAWYGNNSENHMHKVGTKLPNAFGLYDMHGNVREWCEDEYSGDGKTGRLNRGGSWQDDAGHCTLVSRVLTPPDDNNRDNLGFRLVATQDVNR